MSCTQNSLKCLSQYNNVRLGVTDLGHVLNTNNDDTNTLNMSISVKTCDRAM